MQSRATLCITGLCVAVLSLAATGLHAQDQSTAPTAPVGLLPQLNATATTQPSSDKKADDLAHSRDAAPTEQDAPARSRDAAATDHDSLTDRQIAFHVLNRLSFGPKPGEVNGVLATGYRTWIEQQLQPWNIQDDAIDAEVQKRWPSTLMGIGDVYREYKPPIPPIEEVGPERYMQLQRDENARRDDIRRDLQRATLYRAVYSDRRLYEVMCDFWRNHFNIDQNKDDVAYMAADFEYNVIRRNAFGRFEDMLVASSRHPAMLVYLDNYVSQKPLNKYDRKLLDRYAGEGYKGRRIAELRQWRGLNENYARELMELHTLGVDNGYGQGDVVEMARMLTGWTIGWVDGHGRWVDNYMDSPDIHLAFRFDADAHDIEPKTILGVSLRQRSDADTGELVVRSLARHPNAATFISWKLCRYLLQDNPSTAMVQRVAGVFRETGGDLPKVYAAILLSDEFLDAASHRNKFKTPMEFLISSLRVTDAKVTHWDDALYGLSKMGEPPHQMQDPTGYSDQAEAWLDPGVMVYRWAFALKLARGQIEGVTTGKAVFAGLPKDPQARADALLVRLLPEASVSDQTREAIRDRAKDGGEDSDLLGLVLGSPEFQQQ